jgi:hypothetical protein
MCTQLLLHQAQEIRGSLVLEGDIVLSLLHRTTHFHAGKVLYMWESRDQFLPLYRREAGKCEQGEVTSATGGTIAL